MEFNVLEYFYFSVQGQDKMKLMKSPGFPTECPCLHPHDPHSPCPANPGFTQPLVFRAFSWRVETGV